MWKFKFRNERTGAFDLRLALYGGFKIFAFIFAVGIMTKVFVCDSLRIDGTQMEPTIMAGDRILLFKLPYKIPFIKNARVGNPAVVALADRNAFSILRVTAVSGDTVSIYDGQFYRNGTATAAIGKDTAAYDVIPAEYSPGDFMSSLRVPAPNDSINFQTLGIRDFIFAYSIFRQETPGASLTAHILEGDSIVHDYPIRNFALYQGSLDAIPETAHTNWFFWSKLQDYLDIISADGETPPKLAFTVRRNGQEIEGFKVKKHYAFLLGDNWDNARDSRHFGPLQYANIKGRPFMTIWGYETGEDGKRRFNGKRIGRFIK